MTRLPRDILRLRALRLAYSQYARPLVPGDCLSCGREGVVEGSPYCRGCQRYSRSVAGTK